MSTLTTLIGSILLAFALGGVGGFFKGISHEKDKEAVRLARAVDVARQKEANWQSDAQVIEEVHQDEIDRLSASLAAARAGLRNRPANRVPAAAGPSCDGASPAALSAEDAGVALGLAAEADRLRADLEAYKAWAKTVTGKK